MTAPMPTDETPSAGAVAKIREMLDDCHCPSAFRDRNPCDGWLDHRKCDSLALALDAFAREREASVWEEAANEIPSSWLDPLLTGPTAALTGRANWGCPDIERLLWELSKRLRTRAAEARRTG